MSAFPVATVISNGSKLWERPRAFVEGFKMGSTHERPIPKSAATHGCRMLLLLMMVAGGACASVPKESILLSQTIGDDIRAVHTSYTSLIRTHFASLRERSNTFLDTRWTPTYLRDFIRDGELVALATDPDPVQVLEGVGDWAEIAISEIESKRRELLDPIDRDERELLASVDDAFGRLAQANAAVTAHLRSIRRVKDSEDQALQTLRLRELRDSVTVHLAGASARTEKVIEELGKASGEIRDTAHTLGWAGIAETVEPLSRRQLRLVSATHSVRGDVGSAIGQADDRTEGLEPGQFIDLVFDAKDVSGGAQLALFARGRYELGSAHASPGRVLASYLAQNNPNPFNPVTEIPFGLLAAGQTRLQIFDVAGRLVRTLVDRELPAGMHSVLWMGEDELGKPVASGVYFYLIRSGTFSERRRMVLLR